MDFIVIPMEIRSPLVQGLEIYLTEGKYHKMNSWVSLSYMYGIYLNWMHSSWQQVPQTPCIQANGLRK